ncbi:MAG: hypothetical protein ACTHZN_02715 [Canibacter sp.]
MRNTLSRRARKGLAWATSAVVATAGLMLAPTAAIADDESTPVEVTSASLQWGVKSSFITYIRGAGTIAPQGSNSELRGVTVKLTPFLGP